MIVIADSKIFKKKIKKFDMLLIKVLGYELWIFSSVKFVISNQIVARKKIKTIVHFCTKEVVNVIKKFSADVPKGTKVKKLI